jgi:CMP-N-acetylneuraminic acid synthetase
MIIKAFLPCRSGSQRIKNKNIRKFSKYKFGLFQLKVEQLIKVKELKEIIISTDDTKIINFLKKKKYKKIKAIKRPKNLSSSRTKTDDLIIYASKLFNENDHILWTHITSPLFGEKDYSGAIKVYKSKIKKYDTVIGANIIQDFIFNNKNPINYNYKKTYWPNTQNLKKLYKINNTFFLTSAKNYIIKKNRIGSKIFFLDVEKMKSIDIDWPEDFKIAEKIYENKLKS